MGVEPTTLLRCRSQSYWSTLHQLSYRHVGPLVGVEPTLSPTFDPERPTRVILPLNDRGRTEDFFYRLSPTSVFKFLPGSLSYSITVPQLVPKTLKQNLSTNRKPKSHYWINYIILPILPSDFLSLSNLSLILPQNLVNPLT